jgi:Fe-S cluster biogenesis protein NfuA
MAERTSIVKTREDVLEVLKSLEWLMETHEGFFELGEINGNEVVIYCSGVCTSCDTKCILEAIEEKLPHLKVTFR